MTGLTKMWRIKEAPQFEVEQTPGAWVIWGRCCLDENCPKCGGTNSQILDSCGFREGTESMPAEPEIVRRVIGLTKWTPIRIQ